MRSGAGWRSCGDLAGAFVVAVAFVALAAWSWGRWTDPQIDFGNELYLAWRLSEGATLYADMAHRGGPLSHAWNGLLFRVFGASLGTLVWWNLAILAAICGLVFAIARRPTGPAGATLAVLVLLGAFAFSNYTTAGNFNYVTPYHHFQTHGVALSLTMILGLLRSAEGGGARSGALAGLCFGALLLTKVELAVPAAVTAAAGLVLVRGAAPDRSRAAWLGFGGAAPAVPLAFLGLLAARMPLGTALGGLAGNWAHLGPSLTDPFYRAGAGLDDVPGNLARAALATLALALPALALLAADRAVSLRGAPREVPPLLAGVLFALLVALPGPGRWLRFAPALPWVALIASAGFTVAALRDRARPGRLAALAPGLLWSLWSLALLAKMPLAARLHQYGFVLAMPATLLLALLWVCGLPAAARRLGGDGSLARAGALALVGAAVLGLLRISDARYAATDLPVGPARDAIRVLRPPRGAPPGHGLRRGEIVGRLHERLARLVQPGQTLLVFPEGALLNYWLRAPNPSRFSLLLPTELDAFGADVVQRDVESSRPDWVVLLHRDAREFGADHFGADSRSGKELLAWVRSHYRLVERIGAEPFRGVGFGAEIWRRAGASEAAS